MLFASLRARPARRRTGRKAAVPLPRPAVPALITTHTRAHAHTTHTTHTQHTCTDRLSSGLLQRRWWRLVEQRGRWRVRWWAEGSGTGCCAAPQEAGDHRGADRSAGGAQGRRQGLLAAQLGPGQARRQEPHPDHRRSGRGAHRRLHQQRLGHLARHHRALPLWPGACHAVSCRVMSCRVVSCHMCGCEWADQRRRMLRRRRSTRRC
jgi:hypothetical protein